MHQPIYYPRYLSFTAPGVALLLGLCVVAVGRSRSGIAALLVVFAFAATPNYLAQRGPYAKESMDYSQVADVISRYAKPGDCLVMDNSDGVEARADPAVDRRPARRVRQAARLWPRVVGDSAKPVVGRPHCRSGHGPTRYRAAR